MPTMYTCILSKFTPLYHNKGYIYKTPYPSHLGNELSCIQLTQ